jgi:hypothetical protein
LSEEYQLQSRVCGLKMELRVREDWNCEPFAERWYGNPLSPEPDCRTCETRKKYLGETIEAPE